MVVLQGIEKANFLFLGQRVPFGHHDHQTVNLIGLEHQSLVDVVRDENAHIGFAFNEQALNHVTGALFQVDLHRWVFI